MSAIILATGWYAATLIEPRWPDWWEQHIAGDASIVDKQGHGQLSIISKELSK